MRKFRFPLASLEKLLARREERARARAVAARAKRRRAEALLEHLHLLHRRILDERRQRRRDAQLPPSEEHLYNRYFRHMHRSIGQQSARLSAATEEHRTRQHELRRVATRAKILAILHERRKASHRRRQLRELTRTLDDTATQQFLRTRTHEPTRAPAPPAHGPVVSEDSLHA